VGKKEGTRPSGDLGEKRGKGGLAQLAMLERMRGGEKGGEQLIPQFFSGREGKKKEGVDPLLAECFNRQKVLRKERRGARRSFAVNLIAQMERTEKKKREKGERSGALSFSKRRRMEQGKEKGLEDMPSYFSMRGRKRRGKIFFFLNSPQRK